MDFRVDKTSAARVLRRPQEGLRAVVDRAPQAEVLIHGWFERVRPAGDAIYAARRRLATAAVVLLTGWLFLHVMFGANGMVVYRTKRTEYQRLQAEIQRLQKENNRYTQQIKDLQTDPKAIEKEAREQLHYTRPGEVIYVQPVQSKPGTNAARK
jgi:cell division protein FtsB